MYVLQQVEFHPSLHSLPPAEALDMLAVTMSVYRQSRDGDEGDFRRCGQRCLDLLSKFKLHEWGQELAASICTVAWECVAVTVQRGWSIDGIPLLERINRILDERKLWPLLKPGRAQSIRRLMHWGQVVSFEKFDDVVRRIQKHGSLIDQLDPKTIYEPVEMHNVVMQKTSELLRFSLVNKSRYGEQARDYFDTAIRPVLAELARESRGGSDPSKLLNSLPRAFTPATATGIAFQSFLAALHLQPDATPDIIENALLVGRHIRRASDSAIMLQTINPETQELIRSGKVPEILRPEISALFTFVNDISERGKNKLHAIAQQLLECVPLCSGHS
jgi:hypothetical protein